MELKRFIQDVLEQMDDLKNVQQKKNYLVEELEFELTLTQTENGNVGVYLFGVGAGINGENQNAHKVKVKLIPRNTSSKATNIKS